MEVTIVKNKESEKLEEILNQPYILILFNDDKHTFEFVITCLMSICNHTYEQATQVSYTVHYKGKCDVKRGSKEYITKKMQQLRNNGLTVTMETI